jgi:hypothetical protein
MAMAGQANEVKYQKYFEYKHEQIDPQSIKEEFELPAAEGTKEKRLAFLQFIDGYNPEARLRAFPSRTILDSQKTAPCLIKAFENLSWEEFLNLKKDNLSCKEYLEGLTQDNFKQALLNPLEV